jgi:hypothetical protein
MDDMALCRNTFGDLHGKEDLMPPAFRPRYNDLDITPTQVALELLKLSRELADATADLEKLEEDAVRLRTLHDRLYDQAVLQANEDEMLTAGDTRKAWARSETHQARLDAGVADAKVRARRTLIDTLKTRVTIGQSVATALRSELDLEGLRSR